MKSFEILFNRSIIDTCNLHIFFPGWLLWNTRILTVGWRKGTGKSEENKSGNRERERIFCVIVLIKLSFVHFDYFTIFRANGELAKGINETTRNYGNSNETENLPIPQSMVIGCGFFLRRTAINWIRTFIWHRVKYPKNPFFLVFMN